MAEEPRHICYEISGHVQHDGVVRVNNIAVDHAHNTCGRGSNGSSANYRKQSTAVARHYQALTKRCVCSRRRRLKCKGISTHSYLACIFLPTGNAALKVQNYAEAVDLYTRKLSLSIPQVQPTIRTGSDNIIV